MQGYNLTAEFLQSKFSLMMFPLQFTVTHNSTKNTILLQTDVTCISFFVYAGTREKFLFGNPSFLQMHYAYIITPSAKV